MRISKLKIFGFKSFAQRTEISFPGNGLTAVVGPNGCGKSNIVDAIRWVLGEQKSSVLRMGKMQDVIFSGTEERAAMSLAEVSLVISNDNHELPLPYSEIMVTRRAHRNGNSEYLINNQECRLKDIQNLFFDSGLGTGTYSQMDERMINAVLSDKAEDRRSLFEEAAGVSKYKQQRKETLRQLERVQIDMDRVADNLNNTRRSVRQFEKQADKTREWKRLREDLKKLDLSFSIDKFEDHKNSISILDKSRKRVEHELESSKTRLTVLQSQIDDKRLAILDDENQLRDLEQQVQKKELHLNNLNHELIRYRENKTSLEDSVLKHSKEIEEANQKTKDLSIEKESLQQKSFELGAEEEINKDLHQLEVERELLTVLQNKYDELKLTTQDLAEQRVQAIQDLNQLRSHWTRGDTEKRILLEELQKKRQEQEKLEKQKNEYLHSIKSISTESQNKQKELELLQEKNSTHSEIQLKTKEEISSLEQSFFSKQNTLTGIQSRLETLLSMDLHHDDASKWLLENRKQDVLGLLKDEISVNPLYTSEVEFALGEALDLILLEDESSTIDILQGLEKASTGKAMLAFSVTTDFQEEKLPNHESIIAPLHSFITAKASIKKIIQALLANWILVKSPTAAYDLSQNNPHLNFWFISENKAFHPKGFIKVGLSNTESTGVLARKIEIQNLNKTLLKEQNELKDIEDKLLTYKRNLQENEDILNALKEDLTQTTTFLQVNHSKRSIEENSLQNIEKLLEQLQSELDQISSRLSSMSKNDESNIEIEAAESKVLHLEEEYQVTLNYSKESELEYRNKENDIREIELRLGEKQSMISTSSSRLKSIEEQLLMYGELSKNRRIEIENFQEKIQGFELKSKELTSQIETQHQELSVLEEKRDLFLERYRVVSADIEEWRNEERQINESLLQKTSELKDLERRLEAITVNMERLRERIFSEWEVDLTQSEAFDKIDYDLSSIEKEIREIRGKISALGPVNQGIMEDFEEEKKRLLFVEKQFEDLDKSRSSLERTIHKLDIIARERFMDTFHKIQKNFQEIFSRLMHDGGTKLTLQEGVDPLEAEIEVNARPTGKKMRGVRALSGGERALTAVSLLFAIYMEKPSPYCVLDEVDGPLDDANIGRFMELLRHFSKQTQFVLVTHNKRTMAAADMLYGVTQEIKGISKIASVKLDDAVGFSA